MSYASIDESARTHTHTTPFWMAMVQWLTTIPKAFQQEPGSKPLAPLAPQFPELNWKPQLISMVTSHHLYTFLMLS